jgi:hypothetical protein
MDCENGSNEVSNELIPSQAVTQSLTALRHLSIPPPPMTTSSMDQEEEMDECPETESTLPDELQRFIEPDTYTVLDDDEGDLRSAGLIINTQYRVVICLACLQAIPIYNLDAHISAHIQKKHILLPVKEGLASRLQQKFQLDKTAPSIRPEPLKSLDPLPKAIFGLRLLTNRIFCNGCSRGYTSKASLATHQSKKNCGRGYSTGESGFAQTFYLCGKRFFFPVRAPSTPLSPNLGNLDVTLFLDTIPKEDLANTPADFSSNSQELSHFLRIEGWYTLINGLTPAVIQGMVASSEDTEEWELAFLQGVGESYFNRIQEERLQYLQYNMRQAMAERSIV